MREGESDGNWDLNKFGRKEKVEREKIRKRGKGKEGEKVREN